MFSQFLSQPGRSPSECLRDCRFVRQTLRDPAHLHRNRISGTVAIGLSHCAVRRTVHAVDWQPSIIAHRIGRPDGRRRRQRALLKKVSSENKRIPVMLAAAMCALHRQPAVRGRRAALVPNEEEAASYCSRELFKPVNKAASKKLLPLKFQSSNFHLKNEEETKSSSFPNRVFYSSNLIV